MLPAAALAIATRSNNSPCGHTTSPLLVGLSADAAIPGCWATAGTRQRAGTSCFQRCARKRKVPHADAQRADAPTRRDGGWRLISRHRTRRAEPRSQAARANTTLASTRTRSQPRLTKLKGVVRLEVICVIVIAMMRWSAAQDTNTHSTVKPKGVAPGTLHDMPSVWLSEQLRCGKAKVEHRPHRPT
eukprot:7442834-Alexandrium_andersonii.AAC.1